MPHGRQSTRKTGQHSNGAGRGGMGGHPPLGPGDPFEFGVIDVVVALGAEDMGAGDVHEEMVRPGLGVGLDVILAADVDAMQTEELSSLPAVEFRALHALHHRGLGRGRAQGERSTRAHE